MTHVASHIPHLGTTAPRQLLPIALAISSTRDTSCNESGLVSSQYVLSEWSHRHMLGAVDPKSVLALVDNGPSAGEECWTDR